MVGRRKQISLRQGKEKNPVAAIPRWKCFIHMPLGPLLPRGPYCVLWTARMSAISRGSCRVLAWTVIVRWAIQGRDRKKQILSSIHCKQIHLIFHFLWLMHFNGGSFFCSLRQRLSTQIKTLKYDCCRLTSAKTSVSWGKFMAAERVFPRWWCGCILVEARGCGLRGSRRQQLK